DDGRAQRAPAAGDDNIAIGIVELHFDYRSLSRATRIARRLDSSSAWVQGAHSTCSPPFMLNAKRSRTRPLRRSMSVYRHPKIRSSTDSIQSRPNSPEGLGWKCLALRAAGGGGAWTGRGSSVWSHFR